MADFNLSNVNFWPKWQRYAFITVFFGAGLGLSWFWQIQPLRLQQRTLALAEIQLPQGGFASKPTDLSAANKASLQLTSIGGDELKKAIMGMLENDALLLEKWIPSDQGWTLQVSGAYTSIFNVMQNLAQGPIVWDLQGLNLRRLGPANVRLSVVAKPLARSHELSPTPSRYSSARGLQQAQKQKPLFATENALEPVDKAAQNLTPRALPRMVTSMALLGIVGLGGQERRAIFEVRGTSHIVRKGDALLDWQVVKIEKRWVQLKRAKGQVLVVDLFNPVAAHEQ